MLQQLNILWTTHHVKGHQSGPNLTWEAQLNNRANALATESRETITTNLAKKQVSYPAGLIHLQLNNNIIT
eukprot:5992820-Ditylum_brightwellii.AAC.1